jgi:hypothetical protein
MRPVSEFIMIVTRWREEVMEQMTTVACNSFEQPVVGLGTNAVE